MFLTACSTIIDFKKNSKQLHWKEWPASILLKILSTDDVSRGIKQAWLNRIIKHTKENVVRFSRIYISNGVSWSVCAKSIISAIESVGIDCSGLYIVIAINGFQLMIASCLQYLLPVYIKHQISNFRLTYGQSTTDWFLYYHWSISIFSYLIPNRFRYYLIYLIDHFYEPRIFSINL